MSKIKIKFKKLSPNAVLPRYAKEGDMCMDMTALSVEYNEQKDCYIYHTGLAFESPMNVGSLLFVRSSNSKTDAYLANHVGVADIAGYRGEIMFVFKNRTSYEVRCMLEEWKYMNKLNSFEDVRNSKSLEETISLLKAHGMQPFTKPNPMDYAPYEEGDRIGQMMIVEIPEVELEECDELSDSERGTGGFGSTGK